MRTQLYRLSLAVNVLLALVLVICFTNWFDSDPARAATRSPFLTAEDLHVLRVEDAYHGPERIMLTFCEPMVEADQLRGEPADFGMTLEPETRLLGIWQAEDVLMLTPARPLRRATRYTLHFGKALTMAGGRTAPQGLEKAFATPSIAVRRVVVDGEDATDEHAFVVGFDMAVDTASLRNKLEVTSHGRPVPAEVTDLQLADEHAYRVVLRPAKKLDFVDLRIHAGLEPVRGDVFMLVDVRRRVTFREPLHLTSAKVRSGAIVLAFNRTCPLPRKDQVQLVPAIPFQVFRTYQGVRLVGEFKPGSTLSVRFAKGFPGSGRALMAAGARRSLMVPEARPELKFAQHGSVLSSRARPELQISGVNVAEFGFSIRRLYTNNVMRHVQSRGRDTESMFEPPRKKTFQVGTVRNEPWTQRVKLVDLLQEHPAGIYRVGIWDPSHRAGSKTRIVQVTDLGLTVRASPSAVAVHVRSIATGKSIAEAEVQVVTPTNQGLAFGTTDANGVVVLAFQKVAADRVPFLVQVRKDRDVFRATGCVVRRDHGQVRSRRLDG